MDHPHHWELAPDRIIDDDQTNPPIGHDDFGGVGVPNSAEQIFGVDPLQVNKMLSNELNQLSLDRREQVLEEIHGVKSCGRVSLQSSSDDLLTSQQQQIALEKFQEELDKYYFSDTTELASDPFASDHSCNTNQNCRYPAYRYARENGSELINDRDFWLTFFGRGEGGDCPKKGARRMLNYLELIRQIYDTDDVLFRPICLSDLDETTKEFMYEKAPLQILPIRDPSGRRIFVQLRDFGPFSCPVLVRVSILLIIDYDS